jgi:hypothetical protein
LFAVAHKLTTMIGFPTFTQLEASLLNFFGFPRPVRFTAGDIHYPADKTPFFSFAAHNR